MPLFILTHQRELTKEQKRRNWQCNGYDRVVLVSTCKWWFMVRVWIMVHITMRRKLLFWQVDNDVLFRYEGPVETDQLPPV